MLPTPEQLRKMPTAEIEKIEGLYYAAREELRFRLNNGLQTILEDKSIVKLCRKKKIPRTSLHSVLHTKSKVSLLRLIYLMNELGITDKEISR